MNKHIIGNKKLILLKHKLYKYKTNFKEEKIMKKVVALVLAAMLALSFAACGEKEVAQTGDVTVNWIVPGEKQADLQSVLDAANEITMEKLGVKLNLTFIDNAAFTQRMNMYFASGNSDFDLCFTGYINPYKDTVEKGAYLELDEYIEGSEIIKEAIPEYARKTSTYKGKIYALPNMQIMATSCTGLFVQEDLAEEYGLNPEEIKDLEDIEPFLAWVKEKHPELYGFKTEAMGGGTEAAKKLPRADGFSGGTKVYKNEDGSFTVTSPLTKEDDLSEANLIRSWFEKGYIRQDIASVTDESTDQTAGKYAVWRGVYKPGVAAESNANNPNNRCIAIQITDAYMPFDAGSTTMTAINAASKHPDEAFKIIELANSDAEFFNLLAFGIEGKHYNLDADGKIVKVENSGYNPSGAWKFGSVFNSLLVPGQADDLWEQTIAFNDAAEKSPLMGFSFDTAPVRTEIAQISTVSSKYKQGGRGFEPVEAWRPNYLKELEIAGVEAVRAELEKQVNAWAESNK